LFCSRDAAALANSARFAGRFCGGAFRPLLLLLLLLLLIFLLLLLLLLLIFLLLLLWSPRFLFAEELRKDCSMARAMSDDMEGAPPIVFSHSSTAFIWADDDEEEEGEEEDDEEEDDEEEDDEEEDDEEEEDEDEPRNTVSLRSRPSPVDPLVMPGMIST